MASLSKYAGALSRSASQLNALRPMLLNADELTIPDEICEVVFNTIANVECDIRRVVEALSAHDVSSPDDGGEPMLIDSCTPQLRLVCGGKTDTNRRNRAAG